VVAFSFPEDQWGGLAQGGLDEKLGGKRIDINRLMKTNPKITVSEIAEALQISRTATDKNIQILKSKGYINRQSPAKGGHWVVLK
jgi:predicted HTH transcriptional regulator